MRIGAHFPWSAPPAPAVPRPWVCRSTLASPALKLCGGPSDAPRVSLLSAVAHAGHVLTLVPLPEQAVVLAMLVGCGVWASLARTRLAVVALVLCAAMWLRANSQLEGAVLITFTPAHGLTLADLLVPSIAALVLAGRRTAPQRAPQPS